MRGRGCREHLCLCLHRRGRWRSWLGCGCREHLSMCLHRRVRWRSWLGCGLWGRNNGMGFAYESAVAPPNAPTREPDEVFTGAGNLNNHTTVDPFLGGVILNYDMRPDLQLRKGPGVSVVVLSCF